MKIKELTNPKVIVCYVSFDKANIKLIQYASQIAKRLDAKIFFVHSIHDIISASGFYIPHTNVDEIDALVSKGAQDKLYAIVEKAIGDHDPSIRIVKKGNPVDVVNKVASEKNADLLIFGHNPDSFTMSVFRQAYAMKMLKNLNCPMMVIPLTNEQD